MRSQLYKPWQDSVLFPLTKARTNIMPGNTITHTVGQQNYHINILELSDLVR